MVLPRIALIASLLALKEGLFEERTLKDCRSSFHLATSDEFSLEKDGFISGFGLRARPIVDISTRNRTVKVVITTIKKNLEFKTLPFQEVPKEVKDVLKGYLEAIDFEGIVDLDDFQVTFEIARRPTPHLDVSEEAEAATKQTHGKSGPFVDLLESSWTAAYANLLYAAVLLPVNRSFVHSPKLVEELQEIAERVKKGIFEQIDEATWIKNETKDEIRKLFPKERIFFGAPKELSDLTMVTNALDFFKVTFLKFHNDTDLMERLGLSQPNCRGLFLSALLRLANNAFKLQNDDYDFGMYAFRDYPLAALPFFGYNSANYHVDGILLFGVPEINGQLENYPLGFRYGTIGYSIGHEMFHSLGIDNIHVEGGEEIVNHEVYQNAVGCFQRYYEQFKMWQCYDYFNGTKGCYLSRPDGSLKTDEGFADVQAARVLVKAVRNLSEGTDEKREQLDFFFMGLGTNYCDDYKMKRRNTTTQQTQLHRGKHPRMAIRANAIVRQLREYSEHHGCQKGHQMVHAEELCDAFRSLV
ncbi:hypothetical protein QR680_008658 [Steinernema hermaphroditum]|uniref:Peptidase M13 C-terminal domain-containing protein n=1 Tax=Steinernema hermaphroditum TaxID=289476 RepID=A0AA39IHD6_9BILA|nr:hypothetical protein QR680_008658 [Steinernema hermaphroditum]